MKKVCFFFNSFTVSLVSAGYWTTTQLFFLLFCPVFSQQIILLVCIGTQTEGVGLRYKTRGQLMSLQTQLLGIGSGSGSLSDQSYKRLHIPAEGGKRSQFPMLGSASLCSLCLWLQSGYFMSLRSSLPGLTLRQCKFSG